MSSRQKEIVSTNATEKKAVIYARFSSHSQHETSIEGQLKECYAFAKRQGYTVIGEYIDRAMTGTNDNRPDFQRMITDSKKKQFQYVIVYQLDRFARNRYDSASNKNILKKNGVRVVSARENISDDASGILMEAVLEGMAEYYSAELSQKIKRGISIQAEKCLYTGGGVALGYKVNPDKTFSVDEEIAPFVVEIFKRYAEGQTTADINRFLNENHIKTARGKAFNKNSLTALLRNKRYIGTYTFNDMEIPDGIPKIIDENLFNEVQEKLRKNKAAPARSRAKEEYILTTRLYCGICDEMMTGRSGTSRTGRTYNYYACNNFYRKSPETGKRLCDKEPVPKIWIEDLAINKCREVLSPKNIDKIAKAVAGTYKKETQNFKLEHLLGEKRETEKVIENLIKALEQGNAADLITKRIQEKRNELEEIEKQIFKEQQNQFILTEAQIRFFLESLKNGDINDLKYRKVLVNVLIKKIILYDGRITYIFNVGDNDTTISEELLARLRADGSAVSPDSSPFNNFGPPSQNSPNLLVTADWFGFIFYLKQ